MSTAHVTVTLDNTDDIWSVEPLGARTTERGTFIDERIQVSSRPGSLFLSRDVARALVERLQVALAVAPVEPFPSPVTPALHDDAPQEQSA